MQLNPLLPGEMFYVGLSEIEVRMTLRELCGSKWDGYPFEGEVYENSFSLTGNDFIARRNIGNVVLEGSFWEENGKTTVSVSPSLKPRDLAVYLLFAIVGAGILCYGIVEMFFSLLHGGEDFFTAFLSAVAGGIFSGIVYSITVGSYQRSVQRLREAFRSAQRHGEKS